MHVDMTTLAEHASRSLIESLAQKDQNLKKNGNETSNPACKILPALTLCPKSFVQWPLFLGT